MMSAAEPLHSVSTRPLSEVHGVEVPARLRSFAEKFDEARLSAQ